MNDKAVRSDPSKVVELVNIANMPRSKTYKLYPVRNRQPPAKRRTNLESPALSDAWLSVTRALAGGDFADADDFALDEGEFDLGRVGADVKVDFLGGGRTGATFLLHEAEGDGPQQESGGQKTGDSDSQIDHGLRLSMLTPTAKMRIATAMVATTASSTQYHLQPTPR